MTTQSIPYYTADIRALILLRDIRERKIADDALTSFQIISIPNGQHYGENGHIPCKHYLVCEYGCHPDWVESPITSYRTFNGINWSDGIVLPNLFYNNNDNDNEEDEEG